MPTFITHVYSGETCCVAIVVIGDLLDVWGDEYVGEDGSRNVCFLLVVFFDCFSCCVDEFFRV